MTRQGRAHFKVFAVLDGARAGEGTVTIDRATNVFTVRPARRRRTFVLPLATVASIVVAKSIKAELAAQRASKKKGRAR